MKRTFFTWFTFTAMAFTTSGCDSFLAIDLAPQLIESKNILQRDQTAESAVNSVYTHMRTGTNWITNGAPSIYGGLAAGELMPTARNAAYLAFYEHSLLPENTSISNQLWSPAYQTLFRCNALIHGLRNATTLSEDVRNRLLGELLIARAFQYTYLAGFFGDVPLVLHSDYEINATLPRTDYTNVLDQALADLTEARQSLPKNGNRVTKARPSYWAATALLARISLYRSQYAQAVEHAGEVIAAGPSSLAPVAESPFLIGAPETIWEIAPPYDMTNTSEGAALLPPSPSALPPLALGAEVIEAFESGDLRLARWTGRTSGPNPVHYARKYTYTLPGNTHEYLVALRLAEQYLIRAEAHIALGQDELARQDLNRIRQRAGATLLAESVTGEPLTDALRGERQRELFAEWGHRWFDLRRWGINDNPLFPIPQGERDKNPFLT